jgi:hypothetical protein
MAIDSSSPNSYSRRSAKMVSSIMINMGRLLTIRTELVATQDCLQVKRDDQQKGDSAFRISLARAEGSGQVNAAWRIPGGKRVPEGSNL